MNKLSNTRLEKNARIALSVSFSFSKTKGFINWKILGINIYTALCFVFPCKLIDNHEIHFLNIGTNLIWI